MSLPTLPELKKLVEKELNDLKFPHKPEGLYEPVKYALDGGGKRLRPVLMLAMISALGGRAGDYLKQAIALELYHNSTLLHDDVMDNSPLRHGKPTVHKKWNESTAILSGDLMISYSNRLMAENLKGEIGFKALQLLNDTAIKVDEGQQLDMNFEKRNNVSLEEYNDMIMLKTGALFGCACGLGVMLGTGGVNGDFKELLKNAVKTGYLIGLVFQLQDDLLDVYGDVATFGKKIGSDIVNDKKTWLSISALNSHRKKDVMRLMEKEWKNPDDKVASMKEIYGTLQLEKQLVAEINAGISKIEKNIHSMGHAFVEGGEELLIGFVNGITGRVK